MPASVLPQYMRDYCVYYAGPAKTPAGMASGSFGPTTAGRMDSYVAELQAAGGSFVMLAKGNRSRQVTDACKTYGGFYLGSIGGPAARLAQDCITKVDVLEYAELGMEAIWKIEVHDFPRVHRRRRQGQRFLRNGQQTVRRHPGRDQLTFECRETLKCCPRAPTWCLRATLRQQNATVTPGRRGRASPC